MHQKSVISNEDHKKPEIIVNYNATKGSACTNTSEKLRDGQWLYFLINCWL